MKKPHSVFTISLLVLLCVLILSQEAEARRKILRGRKTLTRWYMRKPAIPAWAVATIVGVVQIAFGGAIYILLKICILDKPIQPRYQQVVPAGAP
ncbi:hypothetical protein NQ315_004226 [Exocentrus adspersus]|uniref:Uncharacterized protein n=1 Tax=Exocentrus adspersus TaxID=1586481 RepID=A0AAV8W7H7_9CUCU|nr:hypothetical protein NQ315_004226 [Exocentrus adspersus]